MNRLVTQLSLLLFLANLVSAEAFIRVDQVGYAVAEPKIAIVFSDEPIASGFEIQSAGAVETVLQAKPLVITNAAWGKWKHHAELDFSKINRVGTLKLIVSNAAPVEITIKRNPYATLPDT